ncbi:MAG: 2-amino-4-hydroxy-6-hydroxymethyldihydropteridine diphosphokinase [Candidatus Kapaibacteriota bacterium]
MAICYLSLGSNLGNRFENIQKAVKLFSVAGIRPIRNSSLYETLPYGYVYQPNFLNIVVKCSTGLTAKGLLMTIKDIEISIGRTETIRWGPRVIDIDILLYDNLIIKEEGLTIPPNTTLYIDVKDTSAAANTVRICWEAIRVVP